MLEPLVYNRTQADVNTLSSFLLLTYKNLSDSDKQLWDAHRLKGGWNYTDANRVESYCQYLHDTLESFAYKVSNWEATVTNWSVSSDIFLNDVNRILRNIQALQNAYFAIAGWVTISSMNPMTYEIANAIEHNFMLMLEVIDLMLASFKRANTFRSAEKVLYYSYDTAFAPRRNKFEDLPAGLSFESVAARNLTMRQAECSYKWWEGTT